MIGDVASQIMFFCETSSETPNVVSIISQKIASYPGRRSAPGASSWQFRFVRGQLLGFAPNNRFNSDAGKARAG